MNKIQISWIWYMNMIQISWIWYKSHEYDKNLMKAGKNSAYHDSSVEENLMYMIQIWWIWYKYDTNFVNMTQISWSQAKTLMNMIQISWIWHRFDEDRQKLCLSCVFVCFMFVLCKRLWINRVPGAHQGGSLCIPFTCTLTLVMPSWPLCGGESRDVS